MEILVINGGSSSIKFKVYEMSKKKEILSGLLEKIGSEVSIFNVEKGENKNSKEVVISKLEDGFSLVYNLIKSGEYGNFDIKAVGHRVVHGGEKFKNATLVNGDVYQGIEDNILLAPLHNPAALVGLQISEKEFPSIPNVCVFDTSFHQSIPEYAYMYPIPYKYYENYKVRRYGFHGTSHHYVSKALMNFLGKTQMNIISAHLGNGCSVSAINKGKCMDTSMGVTPLEGLMMGTRSGSIDPSIGTFISEKEGLSAKEVNEIFNKESGLYGICGKSDFRDIWAEVDNGNAKAKLAIDMFCYRVKKQIGSYIAVMDGNVDAIIFTAGVGENDDKTRAQICKGLDYGGFVLDEQKNKGRKKEITEIGKNIYVIPTNEELQIAEETLSTISG